MYLECYHNIVLSLVSLYTPHYVLHSVLLQDKVKNVAALSEQRRREQERSLRQVRTHMEISRLYVAMLPQPCKVVTKMHWFFLQGVHNLAGL